MKIKVYIETSVVSYYTGRAGRDVVIAGHQQSTQEFWRLLSRNLAPYVSALVIKEAGKGDPAMAAKRLDAIGLFPVLASIDTANDRECRNRVS